MRSSLRLIVFSTTFVIVMAWLTPHVLDLARGPVLHWPLAVRAALCLGAIGVVTLVCPARARPLIASMLLARFTVSMGCALGVSALLIYGTVAIIAIFGILHMKGRQPAGGTFRE